MLEASKHFAGGWLAVAVVLGGGCFGRSHGPPRLEATGR
jgi:hypothetical protein